MFFLYLAIDLLVPIAMMAFGWFMWKHTPKEINGLVGYRSQMSMKNQDTWQFAHAHCGKNWWQVGRIMLLPSLLIHIPFYGKPDDTVGILCIVVITLQSIIMLGYILPTEKALRNTFHPDGTRK